jgi:hypothetical protein
MKNSFISADAWIQSGIEALSALENAWVPIQNPLYW